LDWFGLGDAEVELVEEGAVGVGGGVGGGEEFVAVKDGVGAGEEAEGLAFAGEAGAAGGEADAGLGQREAGGGDEAHELEDVHGRLAVEGRAGHGHEAVDGDAFGRGVEAAEDFQHLEAVELGFAHADDAAAADGHAGGLDGADGVEAVVEGVGGDDVGVELGAGVEVVVVGGDAGGAELAGGLGGELAEGDADFHAELGDFADGFEDLGELGVVLGDASPRGAHAEAGAAVGAGALGGLEDAGERREGFAVEAGVVVGALGAVGAVLAAAAGLDAHEGAELDFVVGPVEAVGFARLLDEVEEGQVVKSAEGGKVVSRHGNAHLSAKELPWARRGAHPLFLTT